MRQEWCTWVSCVVIVSGLCCKTLKTKKNEKVQQSETFSENADFFCSHGPIGCLTKIFKEILAVQFLAEEREEMREVELLGTFCQHLFDHLRVWLPTCVHTPQQQNTYCVYRQFFMENSSQSYGASPAIQDHTVLPATRHR